jgi:hypothetical protein
MISISYRKVPVPFLGTICFLGLVSRYRGFVLDDAYIIYRYSQHLAQGQGLVWNIGQPPVEGYTSFLWVLLNALGILLHLDPVILSKLVSLLAALAVIWLLAWASRDAPWSLAAICVGSLALSPPFAFLTMQGLETACATLLVFGSALLALAVAAQPTVPAVSGWFLLAMLAALTRPDTVAFNGGVLLGLLALAAVRGRGAALRNLILAGSVFALAGGAYLAWHRAYFGELLPTPYFIKMNLGRGLLKRSGLEYAATFGRYILLPYLGLAAFLPWAAAGRRIGERLWPLLGGIAAFAVYLLTLFPHQGHLWRYIFPVFPVLLLVLAQGFSSGKRQPFWVRGRAAQILVVLGFAVWTLQLLPLTDLVARERPIRDRELAGRQLAGLTGTMFVSESGALPYFSRWNSVDAIGLTNAAIARRGLTLADLESLNPDLVMILEVSGLYTVQERLGRIIDQYLKERGFVTVAAIHKSQGAYHFYFARPSSSLYPEIVSRLTQIPGLEYGVRGRLLTATGIPVCPRL